MSACTWTSPRADRFQVVVKMDSKPGYVRLPEGQKHVYDDFGPDSIEGWHKKHGRYVP